MASPLVQVHIGYEIISTVTPGIGRLPADHRGNYRQVGSLVQCFGAGFRPFVCPVISGAYVVPALTFKSGTGMRRRPRSETYSTWLLDAIQQRGCDAIPPLKWKTET